MAKLLDKSKEEVLLKLTTNEYTFLKNILEFGDVTDNDFIPDKPAGKELLSAFK